MFYSIHAVRRAAAVQFLIGNVPPAIPEAAEAGS